MPPPLYHSLESWSLSAQFQLVFQFSQILAVHLFYSLDHGFLLLSVFGVVPRELEFQLF